MDPKERRIYHPIQQDYTTFLELSEETGGERTLLEIELAPGGGNDLHFHREFSERFEVLQGELTVRLGKETSVLRKGEALTAPPNALHAFSNASDQVTRFRVELRPGHTGFENALRIMYGLARDGRTNRNGVPKSLRHTAVLGEMGDTSLAGVLSFLQPLLNRLARSARKRGVDRELLERYCTDEAWAYSGGGTAG